MKHSRYMSAVFAFIIIDCDWLLYTAVCTHDLFLMVIYGIHKSDSTVVNRSAEALGVPYKGPSAVEGIM